MPSMDWATADVQIEYDGNRMGFRLANREGLLGYRIGLSPMLAPQVRQSAIGYAHLPPEIDVPVAFEDFSGGGGYEVFDDLQRGLRDLSDALSPRVYNYAQGIDLSWRGGVCLSPARQPTSAIDAAPVAISETSLGIFITAGRYLYEFATAGSATLTQRHDLGVGNAFTGPVVEFTDAAADNTVLVAPAGATAYRYSADGITWSTSATTVNALRFFSVRGQATNDPTLWSIDAAGQLRNTQDADGSAGAGAWSNSVQMGLKAGETVNGMLTADDRLHVFKREGFWDYDGTVVEDVWTGGRQMNRSGNGVNPYVWVNGHIYVPYGDRLMDYDPLAKSAGNPSIRFVFPRDGTQGNSELNGAITAICGDADWLIVFLKNSAGNTYGLKWDGNDLHGWHPFVYLGANDCNTALMVGPGTPHSANPVLLFGFGTAVNYLIWPRTGNRPWDDANCRFDTGASNTAFGPHLPVGAMSFNKHLNAARLITEATNAARTAILQYEINVNGTQTTIVTGNSPGLQTANTSSEVEFNRIRWNLDLLTSDSTVTPRAVGWTFNTVLNPPRKRIFQLDLVIGPQTPERGGGGIMPDVGRRAEEFLFGAVNQRVTLYDRSTRTYSARLIDLQGLGVKALTTGDEMYFTATFAEISETTQSAGAQFVLDQSVLNGADVLG